MTPDPTTATRQALAGIAPEADLDQLAPDADLQEELDLDSMDFLNLIVRIHEKLGVNIPESDYSKLTTLNALMGYLKRQLGEVASG